MSYTNVPRGDNAHILFSRMGADASHPLRGSNPDPQWIPAWAKLTSDEGAEIAIAQAAVNRTWFTDVEPMYTAWWAAFSPVADAQAKQIATVMASKDSHYAKLVALRTLWQTTAKTPAASQSYGRYLLQYQIATAATEVNAAAKAEFATTPFLISLAFDMGLPAKGRKLGSVSEEKEQYFYAAQEGELTPDVPPLPRMEAEYDGGLEAVRWAVPLDRASQIAAQRRSSAAANASLLAAPASIDSFDSSAADGKIVYVDAEGNDHIADGFTSKRVTAIGKDTITMVGLRKESVPYDCKTATVKDTDTGWVHQGRSCSYKSNDTKITLTLQVTELPPVQLAVGDQVSVRGTVKDYKSSKSAVSATLTDVYVESIKRGAQRLF